MRDLVRAPRCPAAISIAGQMTAWNLRMSLPIRWTVGRPELVGEVLALAGVAQRRVVVEERVDPDVDDLRLVPRHRHAPLEPGARQRHVAQAALDERERLVVAVPRRDESGPLGVQPLERLLEGGQPEEPVVLLLDLELDLVDRAAVAVLELGLGLEVGAAGAVPALVGARRRRDRCRGSAARPRRPSPCARGRWCG